MSGPNYHIIAGAANNVQQHHYDDKGQHIDDPKKAGSIWTLRSRPVQLGEGDVLYAAVPSTVEVTQKYQLPDKGKPVQLALDHRLLEKGRPVLKDVSFDGLNITFDVAVGGVTYELTRSFEDRKKLDAFISPDSTQTLIQGVTIMKSKGTIDPTKKDIDPTRFKAPDKLLAANEALLTTADMRKLLTARRKEEHEEIQLGDNDQSVITQYYKLPPEERKHSPDDKPYALTIDSNPALRTALIANTGAVVAYQAQQAPEAQANQPQTTQPKGQNTQQPAPSPYQVTGAFAKSVEHNEKCDRVQAMLLEAKCYPKGNMGDAEMDKEWGPKSKAAAQAFLDKYKDKLNLTLPDPSKGKQLTAEYMLEVIENNKQKLAGFLKDGDTRLEEHNKAKHPKKVARVGKHEAHPETKGHTGPHDHAKVEQTIGKADDAWRSHTPDITLNAEYGTELAARGLNYRETKIPLTNDTRTTVQAYILGGKGEFVQDQFGFSDKEMQKLYNEALANKAHIVTWANERHMVAAAPAANTRGFTPQPQAAANQTNHGIDERDWEIAANAPISANHSGPEIPSTRMKPRDDVIAKFVLADPARAKETFGLSDERVAALKEQGLKVEAKEQQAERAAQAEKAMSTPLVGKTTLSLATATLNIEALGAKLKALGASGCQPVGGANSVANNSGQQRAAGDLQVGG